MKKEKRVQGRKKAPLVLKVLLVLAVLALAGFLYFLYDILPSKVAQAIVAKTAVHTPLTDNPQAHGVGYQDVLFTSSDGVTLSGWWMPAGRKPQGTVILTHGLGHNRDQVLDRALYLHSIGWQVLLFDLRGHGLSGESPVSGGLLEAKDFLGAEQYLKSQDLLKEPLVFFGFSLGSIAALRAAVQASDVDAVVADSPLANLRTYVSQRTLAGAFARFPGFLDRCLSAYDQSTGLSLTEQDMDLVPIVRQLHGLPVLYFSAEKDDLVKPETVRMLYELSDSKHRRLFFIPDAGHEQTYSLYPIIYQKALKDFLDDLKAGFPDEQGGKPLLLATPKAATLH